MSQSLPVKRPETPYWRSPAIDQGCVSDRGDIADTARAEQDPAAKLLEDLLDLGADFEDDAAALEAIESALDESGDQRAADALAMVFARLPGGREGAKLRQALLGTLGEGAEAARENGVSKQSWCTSIRRLRARILQNGLPPPACVEAPLSAKK